MIYSVREAVKTTSDLFMSVLGKVIAVNTTLIKAPELLNDEPFAAGWMIKIKVNDPAKTGQLSDPKAYKLSAGINN